MEVSVGKVAEIYSQKIETLKNACLMSKAMSESGYSDTLAQPATILDELKVELSHTSRNVRKEELQLKKLEDLKVESSALIEHLSWVMENMPSKLPNQKAASTGQSQNQIKQEQVQKLEPAKPSASQTQSMGCQYLDFLTVQEFQSIPKYMKGRLTYDRVNSVIEKLDKVYVERYKIRRHKKSSLNDANKKRYEAYRLQETEETKGIHFIVEQDITDFSSLKMDNTLRNIFTILRHCGLIFEMRGGGFTRFGCYSRY